MNTYTVSKRQLIKVKDRTVFANVTKLYIYISNIILIWQFTEITCYIDESSDSM